MSKIVDRTMAVFELFAQERRPLSLTDMTRLLDIPLSSCHDVIHALEARGYVYEIAPRAGYYPTRRLLNICNVISDHDSLVQRATPLLEALRDELQESITLAKATDLHVVYLQVLEPANPIRFTVQVGTEVRSIHATSAGKAVLGNLAPETLRGFLQSAELKRFTSATLTAKSKLMADIERSRERGWYLNNEESLDGVVTVSASFMWNGACHVVTAAGLAGRMHGKLDQIGRAVVRVCQALGEAGR